MPFKYGIVLAAFGLPGNAATGTPPPGVWANPANSVHVAFKRCGAAVCGTVVWASAKAKADAQRGGTERLVGAQLFRDFVEESPGRWAGEVFVPDIGRTFSGTLMATDSRTLTGEGCLLPGVGCRAQTWKRIN
ncbi:DUF2147 domain-containing protein [Sphingomonas sp.]|jgi:uncharacterized protein (DUF2147 family)|uniref:DUF2147 domain-containing protein n=1 Tax=Sphingomonas sp. TaxID=28214 RepID=UPI002E34C6A7|nr:DUF2147 domain-containing protein [Sphingomonas sp.]HEX4694434.1 DUF2147 domain-containing protein [Sphingomonas sp.]